MAISGGDGSIILTTKVDTKGLDAAMAKMRQQAKGTGSAFESLSNFIKIQETRLASLRQQYASYVLKNEQGSVAAKKLVGDIKNLSTSLTQNQARLNAASASAVSFGAKAKTAIAGVGASLKVLASYLIGIQTIFAVINFSKQAGEFATQTEASVQRLVDIYGEASQVVGDFIDANARAIGMSKSAGASIAATYGNLLSVWADQATNAEITNALLNQTAVVASKTGRTTTDVAERIRSGLLGNTEAIEDLGINVNIKTIEITDAFKRIADGRSWEQLNVYEQSQVRTLAILEQSTNKYGTAVSQTSATVRNQYQAAYEDFKNAWGQVVNKVLIPVLKVLTQVFTIATKGLQIIAGLTGKTIDTNTAFSSQEKAIGGAVDNQEALTDAVKDTNKELKKSLANFDEINILSQNTAESSGSGATGAGAGGGVGVGGIGDLGLDYDNSFVKKISGDMAAIMAIVGGALAAVGLLLIFCGNIGWGIGFLIAGASIFAVSMATLLSSDQITPISKQLMKILAIAGTALAALGLILLFSGVWKLGIAFLVAGAAALGVAIVATKSGKVDKEAKEMLIKVMTVAGAAMLALGVILLCFGVVSGLSIGLVVAGAASLAGAIALNPKLVLQNVSDFLKDNAGLIVGISLALLVLGIILCCVGVVTPLSIGLIVAGATGLVTEIVLNWNYVKDSVTKLLKDNSGLIVGISLALLVLGIILCCVGVITPLSIGLIVAGAVGLATEIALNWGKVKNSITTFLKDNSGLIVGISIALLVLGIILCCVGVVTPLSIGLIVVGATGLVTEIVLNWSYIKQSISDFIKNNSGLIVGIAAALVVLGIILLFTGVAIPLAIGLIVAGGVILATEAVLNWDYITQSITNFIKNNSGLIVGVSLALLVLGIILCCTGVALPLGIGLIVVGAAGLAAEVALNWDTVKEKVTKAFNNTVDWVKGWGLLVLGIILVISGVGLPLGLALMKKGGANLTEAQDPLWTTIVDKVKETWDRLKQFWNTHVAKWFTKAHWANLGKNIINGLIGSIERGLNYIIRKINTLSWVVPDWVPGIGGKKWGFNFREISIPRLAKGAVIPPNREFLAVLGDQKQGVNIEAPLQTIVDAFNIALQGNANYGGGSTEVVLEIDGREFGRAVVEQGNRENRRIGTRLVIV